MIRGSVALGAWPQARVTIATGPRDFLEAESWIQPFQHKAVRVATRQSIAGTTIRVSADPADHRGEAGVAEHLEISSTPQSPLSLETSGMLVPIYAVRTNHHVLLSWDLGELVALAPHLAIDRDVCRDYIFGRQVYTDRTIFSSITRVTERSNLRVSAAGVVTTELPVDAASFDPSEVLSGVDATGAYMGVMREAIESKVRDATHVISELSGGYDSTNITMAAADVLGRGLETYGLIFPGEAGRNQSARRAEAIRAANLSDSSLSIERYPFLNKWLENEWIDPYEELYAPLVQGVLAKSMVRAGETVVLTGIGGDEAMLPLHRGTADSIMVRGSATTARFPKSRLPETTILACTVRAPMFMRMGIWPMNPYCGQLALEFSERLPDHYKESRALQRDALIRWGISQHSLKRPLPENFEFTLRAEIARVEPQLSPRTSIACVELGVLTQAEWDLITMSGSSRLSLSQLSNRVRARTLEASLSRVA